LVVIMPDAEPPQLPACGRLHHSGRVDRGNAAGVLGNRSGKGAGGAGSGQWLPIGSGAPAEPPTSPSFVLTSTISPSWTRICTSIPDAGLSTSASTLSADFSSSNSSARTCSPSRFSHFMIVPSDMHTPICGMRTSKRYPPLCDSYKQLPCDRLQQLSELALHRVQLIPRRDAPRR
jgi:hypothetical protein